MTNRKNKQAKIVKRTVKYLSIAPDTEAVRSVLQSSPDAVIRAVANAALNARQGDVQVPPKLKRLFSKYHRHIDYLTDRRRPLIQKRRLLVQREGFLPVIAPLIPTAYKTVGGEFISRIFRKDE